MEDQTIILSAYAEELKHLFTTLNTELRSAEHDNQREAAKKRFVHGLQLLREHRDIALALM